MSSTYEFWLTDDSGRRFAQLDNYSFASYTRTVAGFGTIQFGMPYRYYKSLVPDFFKPDWRIDVWRSPEENYPMRREGSFFLRKPVVYERIDGMNTIELYGRSPIDILRRGDMCYTTVSLYEKTGLADDLMVTVVSEALSNGNLVVPSGEFRVDASSSLGPSVSFSAQGENVLDLLNDIRKDTIALNRASPSSYRKIYFDVVEDITLPNGGFGYVFKTYASLRGNDRTGSGLIFSSSNGNIRKPTYYEDYLDEITIVGAIYSAGPADCRFNVNLADVGLSRWNQISKTVFVGNALNLNRQLLDEQAKNRAQRVFSADFLNTPGGPNQPRSLYGVDWDLGDLVRAEFADKAFDCEIKIVYVAVDENGKENVIGSSEISQ